MAVKQTKTLAAQTTTTTVASGEKFPKVNAQNQTTLITLENLRAAIMAGNDLNALEDGIFIMTQRQLPDYVQASQVDCPANRR